MAVDKDKDVSRLNPVPHTDGSLVAALEALLAEGEAIIAQHLKRLKVTRFA